MSRIDEEQELARATELAELAADGEATADELRELEILMAGSPRIRQECTSIRMLAEELDALPAFDGPPSLQRQVVELIGVGETAEPGRKTREESFRNDRSRPLQGVDFHHQPSNIRGTIMSQNNRRALFIGIGSIAAAVLVVAIFVAPHFPPEKASGAIGVVQKHRAEQITAKDVILGDEKTRREQNIVFADYLNDATKLQSISVDLAAMSMASTDQTAANLQNIQQQLAGHRAQLQNRYSENMTAALAAASEALNSLQATIKAEQLAGMRSELDSLGAALRARQTLNHQDMAAFNSRYSEVAEQLQSRLAARSMTNNRAQLAAVTADLQSRNVETATALNAVSRLQAIDRDLAARSDLASAITNEQQYLGSVAREAETLASASESLEALAANNRLAARDSAQQLGHVVADLASRSRELELAAVTNMNNRMQAESAMAADLAQMSQMLAATQRDLASRSMEASTLASIEREVANLNSRLQSRSSELESALSASMHAELASCASYLQARNAFNARVGIENADLGSRADAAMLNSRSPEAASLDNRAEASLASRADAASLSNRADTALANRSEAVSMASRESAMSELASRFANDQAVAGMKAHMESVSRVLDNKGGLAAALAARADQLQSRSPQADVQ